MVEEKSSRFTPSAHFARSGALVPPLHVKFPFDAARLQRYGGAIGGSANDGTNTSAAASDAKRRAKSAASNEGVIYFFNRVLHYTLTSGMLATIFIN